MGNWGSVATVHGGQQDQCDRHACRGGQQAECVVCVCSSLYQEGTGDDRERRRGSTVLTRSCAVEVSNGDELIAVLLKLQEAVLDGSLDGQIEVAADSVKARFKN